MNELFETKQKLAKVEEENAAMRLHDYKSKLTLVMANDKIEWLERQVKKERETRDSLIASLDNANEELAQYQFLVPKSELERFRSMFTAKNDDKAVHQVE
jgi:hypothetical protein